MDSTNVELNTISSRLRTDPIPRSARVDPSTLDSDKVHQHKFFDAYERFLGGLASKPIRLLELGVGRGGSLDYWLQFFPQGVIAGLDRKPLAPLRERERLRFFQGRQDDIDLLETIANEIAPDGFDVIIDDCSHIAAFTRVTFAHMFQRHLKPGGLYVLEDWGTGYWRNWFDGASFKSPKPPLRTLIREYLGSLYERRLTHRIPLGRKLIRLLLHTIQAAPPRRFTSHSAGMVGFVKQLIDEIGIEDITNREHGKGSFRTSLIESMSILHGQVFIEKATSFSGNFGIPIDSDFGGKS